MKALERLGDWLGKARKVKKCSAETSNSGEDADVAGEMAKLPKKGGRTVSKAEPLNLLTIWLAKAKLKPYPKEAASSNIEAHTLRMKKDPKKYPGGRKQAIAIGISQARAGKKEPKPVSKSLDDLDAWLEKACTGKAKGKRKGKKGKMEKDGGAWDSAMSSLSSRGTNAGSNSGQGSANGFVYGGK